MKISIRIIDQNPAHAYFSIFVNGALTNAQPTCLRVDELGPFLERLKPNSVVDANDVELNYHLL